MSEQFYLHNVLRNKDDSQSQILKQNILYSIDPQQKWDIMYSYAKKECLFLDDEICLFLKRSYNGQFPPHISLNYSKINKVVKKNRNLFAQSSQSINLDNLCQAKVKQQTILMLATTFLKPIVFIFESSQLANQWALLINQNIKKNQADRKKRNQDLMSYSSSNQKNEQIEQLNKIMSHQSEIIKSLKKRIDIMKNSQTPSHRYNFRSFVKIDNNDDETFLTQQRNSLAIINEQIPNIINFLFQQIIKRNNLIIKYKSDNNSISSTIQTTNSHFISNKQDLSRNMAIKLSKILSKTAQQVQQIFDSS